MAESINVESRQRKGARYGLAVFHDNQTFPVGIDNCSSRHRFRVRLVDTSSQKPTQAREGEKFIGYVSSEGLSEAIEGGGIHPKTGEVGFLVLDISPPDKSRPVGEILYQSFFPFGQKNDETLPFQEYLVGKGLAARVEYVVSKHLSRYYPGYNVKHSYRISDERFAQLGVEPRFGDVLRERIDDSYETPILKYLDYWKNKIRDYRWKKQREAGKMGYLDNRPKTLGEVRQWKERHGKSNSVPARRA